MSLIPSMEMIREASACIKPYANKTPILTCSTLNKLFDREIYFKCENFQKVGAFKARGALNAVLSLSNDELSNGIATYSSGNHAAAIAYAAKCVGANAYIVMPHDAPPVKKAAVEGYGAKIKYCSPTQSSREEVLSEILKETDAHFIHPYNDPRVISGQGTVGMELLADQSDIDTILVPVGGGGLMSGTVLATKSMKPRVKVIGVEPAAADDAYRSLAAGEIIPIDNPSTIADGLKTSLGDLTFSVIYNYSDGIVTVTEEEIIKAMRMIWERMKIIIEPSAAVVFAALMSKNFKIDGSRLGLVLSGGNVDLDRLPWVTTSD